MFFVVCKDEKIQLKSQKRRKGSKNWFLCFIYKENITYVRMPNRILNKIFVKFCPIGERSEK